MLNRGYQFLAVMLLTGYATSSFLGWEFVSPMLARSAPPVGAMIGSSSSRWSGRSSTYYHSSGSSSSGTRSGWGGFFGGK